MAKAFHCTIITPTESLLSDEVTYASIPAWDGQMGIIAGRSPVLVKLGTGSLRLDFPEGGSRRYLIDGGFAEFKDDELSLLSDYAVAEERLSLAEAQAELAEANARVTKSGEDQEQVQRQQTRATVKIQLARTHSERGGAI